MTREVRSIFLAVLTLIIYAISIYVKHGDGFVFPFPLNPFFFFVVSAYFIWLNKKQLLESIIIASVATLGVLASPVFWEFVLPLENLDSFYNSPWIHWFYFFNAILLLIWGGYTAYKQNTITYSALTLIGSGALIYAFFFGKEAYLLVGYFIIAISAIARPTVKAFNLLWLLLLILESTKWITYLLA